MRQRNFVTLAVCGAFLLTGCASDSFGTRPVQSSAIGSVLGSPADAYTSGEVIGGRESRARRIAASGMKPIPDATADAYMSRLDGELRRETAGTGVAVYRYGNEFLLRVPSSITFDVGSAAVKAQSRAMLSEVSRTLNAYPATMIDVLGHTDSTGNTQSNQRLSERRAQAVADFIVSRKVGKPRIATQGFGSTRPIASNESETGKSANRRIEIRVVPVLQDDVR